MFVVSSHNYKTKCADAPHAFPADLPHFAKNRRRSCRPPHTHSRRFRPPLWWLSPPLRRALVNLHSSSLHLQYIRGGKKAQYVSFFCKITVTLAKRDGNIVIFAYCDIISLHCPLTEQTKYIIDEEAISKMKNHTILVNTSRGGLCESQALFNALKEKRIGGYTDRGFHSNCVYHHFQSAVEFVLNN